MKRNNLQSHCKSDKIKWIFTGIAFVLIFAMIAGVCLQVFGKGKAKPTEWFNKTEQSEDLPDSDIIVSEDDEAASPLKLSVKKMAAQTTAADDHTTYEITATLTPANTTDVVDMSIAWASSNSANISEYMKLDHADGAFTAIVTALKPFTTTINLTAKVRDRDITKTIKLDYFSVYADFTWFASDTEVSGVSRSLGSDFGVGYYFENVYGSIPPSKIELKAEINFADSIKSTLVGKGFNVDTVTKSCFLDYNNKDHGLSGYDEMIFFKHEWFSLDPNILFPGNSKQSFYNAIYNAIPKASNSKESHVLYSIKFEMTFYITSGGKEIAIPLEYNDGDSSIFRVLDLSSLATPATNMDIVDDLVFW